MLITRRLATLGLLAASALMLALPSQAGTGSPNPGCKHGGAKGGFQLPSAGNPGTMKGVFVDSNGNAVLRIVAKTSPPSSGQPGKIVGALIKKTASGPMKVAEVNGLWVPNDMMSGKFQAVFTVPSSTGPKKVGEMKGGYKNGSSGNGKFKGKWVLCN